MKKTIYTVVAFAVFAASSFASPMTELDVKVPFEFKAGASTFPAGTYRVTADSSGFLLIRGEKGGIFIPRSAMTVDSLEGGKPTFKFNRSGDTYVLQAVHSEK